jgi:hypothetical protein
MKPIIYVSISLPETLDDDDAPPPLLERGLISPPSRPPSAWVMTVFVALALVGLGTTLALLTRAVACWMGVPW